LELDAEPPFLEAPGRLLIAGLFVLGGLLVPVGLLLRPLHFQWFDTSHFSPIADHMGAWIWSFRVLVFGYFLRLGALAALGTLGAPPRARAPIAAGVAICAFASLASALGHAYYLDTGVWGSWDVTHYTTEAARATFLATLRPVNAWGECLVRMGSVFYSLGSIFLGVGLLIGRAAPRWLALFAICCGPLGILAGMLAPNSLEASWAMTALHSAWCLLAASTFVLPPAGALLSVVPRAS
jgi:hypothetical protein